MMKNKITGLILCFSILIYLNSFIAFAEHGGIEGLSDEDFDEMEDKTGFANEHPDLLSNAQINQKLDFSDPELKPATINKIANRLEPSNVEKLLKQGKESTSNLPKLSTEDILKLSSVSISENVANFNLYQIENLLENNKIRVEDLGKIEANQLNLKSAELILQKLELVPNICFIGMDGFVIYLQNNLGVQISQSSSDKLPEFTMSSSYTNNKNINIGKITGFTSASSSALCISSITPEPASPKPPPSSEIEPPDNPLDNWDDLEEFSFKFSERTQMTFPNTLASKKVNAYASNGTVVYYPNDVYADSDKDGLSDSFEKSNSLNINSADTDGDGLTDYEEMMIYSTDARSSNTYSILGYENDFEYVKSLGTGRIVKIMFNGVNLVRKLNLSSTDLFKDSDSDGISDINEYIYGYDYLNPDTDGDGYNDGFELRNDLRPLEKDTLPKATTSNGYKDSIIEVDFDSGGSINADLGDDEITYELEDADLQIKDMSNNTFIHFSANDPKKPMTVNLKKKDNNTYEISTINGRQIIYSKGYNEVLAGDNIIYEASINDGVTYIELSSPGIYEYSDEINFAQNFIIERPENLIGIYRLLVDKYGKRRTDDGIADAYISLVDHKIRLNGIINLLKISVPSKDYYKIIESKSKNNKITILLDDNNELLVFINAENKNIICDSEYQVLIIRNGMLSLEEICIPSTGLVQTYGDYILDNTPYVINGNYEAEFQKKEPVMVFRNNAIIQAKQPFSKSNTIMIADESPLYRGATLTKTEYEKFAKDRCGSLNNYFTQNEI